MRVRKRIFVALTAACLVVPATAAPTADAGTDGRTDASTGTGGTAYRTGGGKAGQPVGRKRAATLSVMSFNVCGGVCRRGEVSRTAGYTVRTALRQRASVVLLQELCFSQFVRVRGQLAAKGYSARFAAQTHSPVCARYDRRYGTGFGVAVLVRGRATGTVIRHLPTRRGFEPRLMLGTTATLGGRRTFVAAVHLSPNPRAGLALELRALAATVNRRTRGPVILGGDFNAMPGNPGLSRFYSAAADGHGRFTELDQMRGGTVRRGGAATFDRYHRKIDYVFVSSRWFGSPRATGIATPMSDHRVYVGSARVAGVQVASSMTSS